jgi:uncharacterized protein YjbJ (UPF0337 family)
MGLDDRLENKAQDIGGRAKEAVGSVTGNASLKAEGEADQKKASLKDKVESVKDKVQEKVDDLF